MIPLDDDTVKAFGRLTSLEVETAIILSKGMSLQETADLLGVTRSTINDRTKVIHKKLGVGTRTEMAVIAAKMGLV